MVVLFLAALPVGGALLDNNGRAEMKGLSKTHDAESHNAADATLTVDISPLDSGAVYYRIGDESDMILMDDAVTVPVGTAVTLQPEPTAEYRFRQWFVNDEPAAGEEDGSLMLVMDTDLFVTADFGRVLQVTLDASPEGQLEVISPEPISCNDDKQDVYCFWEHDEISLVAEPYDPDAHVVNAWWIDGHYIGSDAELFSDQYTFTIETDTHIAVEFTRKVNVAGVSLSVIPVNRSVPITLTGVFPVSEAKAVPQKSEVGLSAEEAELRYEVLVGDTPASFLPPEGTPFSAPGEGITPLDETDTSATNMAYLWSPASIPLPEDAQAIPVVFRDRTNPLNTFSLLLPIDAFVSVATVTIEVLPENTQGVVLTDPGQSILPGKNGDDLILESGDYIVGETVVLTAIEAALFVKYRITVEDAVSQITTPDHALTVTADTAIAAIFESEAYKLSLASSTGGVITANPASSPGWPTGWYEADGEVVLTTTPEPGYRFVAWSHDLAGEHSDPTTLVMDSDKQAGAVFLQPQMTALNILPGEGGDVLLQPEGLVNDTSPNVHIYNAGADVRIIGRPQPGYRFDGWRIITESGDNFLSDNPWDVTLAADYVIAPRFQQVFHLALDVLPENSGEIVVMPAEPAAGYDAGAEVALTALPSEDSDYRFVQWTGANAADVHPNTTTASVTIVMDSSKQLTARFSQLTTTSIEPAEAWVFGGVVARVRGEAITSETHVRFGANDVPVFDVAPSGQYAFVEVPPLPNPGETNSIKVDLALVNGDMIAPYEPGFRYNQRTVSGDLYTAAFTAERGGSETSVLVGSVGGKNAFVTIPPLGEAPVHGIVRAAPSGIIAASRGNALEVMPGNAAGGLYDVGVHLFIPDTGTTRIRQYGVMLYHDATHELLAFDRPYDVRDARPLTAAQAITINMATAPDAGPTYNLVRSGISLWGVASNYDYLYNAETTAQPAPLYQSALQNDEVVPVNDATVAATEKVRALTNARAYGASANVPANSFTWRHNAVLPPSAQRAIQLTAIDNMPVKGVGTGPVEGGTAVTITSPYGGLAWIDSIELVGVRAAVGGKVAARDFISEQGEDEFLLEFQTPRSSRPGMTSIVIRTTANPDAPIVLRNVFEYTRPPIRWWLVLLILLGLMFSVIGMATSG